jgi:hypothetical protein
MIRIIHTLGGCGGTLLSRCIGVLPGVALLSEINPASVKLFPEFDPLCQDRKWFQLLDPAEADQFSTIDLGIARNFQELIEVFHTRAVAASRHLVLRDYSYVNFIGVPFIPDPPCRLILRTALPNAISTASVAFIRHPVDQWVSLSKHAEVKAVLTPAIFCDAYAAFLRELGAEQVYKYEDFVQNPHGVLRAICHDLALPFDPSFIHRFHRFNWVTGDMTRHGDQSISAPVRMNLPTAVIAQFDASKSFEYVLRATSYVRPVMVQYPAW